MNVSQVKAEISKMPEFKNFEWNELKEDNTYASMKVENRSFKDSGKNEYLLGGSYGLFIAHMYKGEKGKEFFYLTLSRQSKRRNFRKHDFHSVEWNKVFASGKSVEAVVNDLKESFENGYDIKL